MHMDTELQITDRAMLRTVYRDPAQGAIDKVVNVIDAGAAGFIACSPFVVLSTATEHRADASPRGGPPGFVRVLDEHHLAWGDLTGNNRLDSFGNLLVSPNVGLLFLVPGVEETLRVNGHAALVQDAHVLDICAIDGRRPKAAVVVTVNECYVQCGAALRRSSLWDVATWPSAGERPSGAAVIKEHLGSDVQVEEIAARLAEYYDHHIWAAGGRDD